MEKSPICYVPDCTRIRVCRGLCERHYTRQRAWGYWKGVLTCCSMCGDCFWSTHTHTLFCSEVCSKGAVIYYNQVWAEKNRKKYRKYHAAYRIEHREKLRGMAEIRNLKLRTVAQDAGLPYTRSPATKRYSRVLRNTVRHRAKAHGWDISISPIRESFFTRMLARYGDCCAYCGNSLNGRVRWDHVTPLSRGGVHGEGNLLPACGGCNASKHKSTVQEWRKRQRLRAELQK